VVVPACDAGPGIESTLARLAELPFSPPLEIVVVENGSVDGTWELLERVQKGWDRDVALVTLRSERGIGAAYRAGVAACTGTWVLLTADDLPFGTSDLDAVLACASIPRFAIGSKAHPCSRVPRSRPRRIATWTFRLARRAIVGLNVGDTQGTFFIEAGLARELVSATTVAGFGMTTELVVLASRRGVQPVELPVVLSEQVNVSRIRWIRDGVDMIVSLVRLRRRFHRSGEVGTASPTTRP
jgi:glycosyltransferase involved in cell wall biosynthesis